MKQMNEGYDKKKSDSRDEDIIFTKSLKAGTRIYYLDVKKNKKNELYLAITESKKIIGRNQNQTQFEKHKIFLYEEDFNSFLDNLNEVMEYIYENNTTDYTPRKRPDDNLTATLNNFDLDSEIEIIDNEFNIRIDF